MTSIRYDDFARRLVEQVPEFADVYREHQKFYGETLNHVLAGELVTFLGQTYRCSAESSARSPSCSDIVARILAFIDEAAKSEDEKVTELVQVSIMENLHELGPYYEAIVSLLGPASRKLLEAAQQ